MRSYLMMFYISRLLLVLVLLWSVNAVNWSQVTIPLLVHPCMYVCMYVCMREVVYGREVLCMQVCHTSAISFIFPFFFCMQQTEMMRGAVMPCMSIRPILPVSFFFWLLFLFCPLLLHMARGMGRWDEMRWERGKVEWCYHVKAGSIPQESLSLLLLVYSSFVLFSTRGTWHG